MRVHLHAVEDLLSFSPKDNIRHFYYKHCFFLYIEYLLYMSRTLTLLRYKDEYSYDPSFQAHNTITFRDALINQELWLCAN